MVIFLLILLAFYLLFGLMISWHVIQKVIHGRKKTIYIFLILVVNVFFWPFTAKFN